ncbi:hypothetical protein QAD02_008028 [Eretmocerus hayati]|uniref:Uncharacterized protein n=1 Tax=Eretmocerus hayati TaxID=131215 RepID=A0ACC2N5K9_9HYME|nr:hypothetical protein QAD02_008028 [Eretmocerus hayati]
MDNLIIPDRSIGEQHCQLQRVNGQWSVTREPGQMSVYVQGTEEVKEGQCMPLFDGQVIQVGECCCFTYQIIFYFWGNRYPEVAIFKIDSIRWQKHIFVSSSLNMERELTRRILKIQQEIRELRAEAMDGLGEIASLRTSVQYPSRWLRNLHLREQYCVDAENRNFRLRREVRRCLDEGCRRLDTYMRGLAEYYGVNLRVYLMQFPRFGDEDSENEEDPEDDEL